MDDVLSVSARRCSHSRKMPVPLLSRGGGGGAFPLLASALSLGGSSRRSSSSSSSCGVPSSAALAFFSTPCAAAPQLLLSPFLCRHPPLTAPFLFPSSSPPPPPPAGPGPATRMSRHQLSCLAPTHAPQQTGPSAAAADPAPSSDPVREAAGSLDFRVGRVLRAWRHPDADSLYVEEVDVGEAEPRTICTGLVGYVPLEALQGARVVVLANLKPRNMRGVKSNGMLLAASDAANETVELLAAPEGAPPGERVWFGAAEADKEEQPEPATPNQVQKKKTWESVQLHLRTDENFVAMLGVHPMQTSAGVVVSRSLKNARIS